jgi:hypothetical protein
MLSEHTLQKTSWQSSHFTSKVYEGIEVNLLTSSVATCFSHLLQDSLLPFVFVVGAEETGPKAFVRITLDVVCAYLSLIFRVCF